MRTLVAIPELLVPRCEIEEDRCLAHGESVSCFDPTQFKPNSDSMHRFDEINRD